MVPRRFNALRVFSATRPTERMNLGDYVSEWITAHPELEVVDVVVAQSSDTRAHCLSIIVFYNDQPAR